MTFSETREYFERLIEAQKAERERFVKETHDNASAFDDAINAMQTAIMCVSVFEDAFVAKRNLASTSFDYRTGFVDGMATERGLHESGRKA